MAMITDGSHVDSMAALLKRLNCELSASFIGGQWRATVRIIGTRKSATCWSDQSLGDALAQAVAGIVAPKGAV